MSSLFVDRRGIEIDVESEALVFREQGERVGTVPIAPLKRVFLRGDVTLKTSVLGKLGEHGIGVVILSGRKAEPTLLLARPHNDAARRVAQYRLSLNADFCRTFAESVVESKVRAQLALLGELRESELASRYPLTVRMRNLDGVLAKLAGAPNVASLRGLEGNAAAEYFAALAEVVPESLHFGGRNRRPPRDPLNALLSLGYTLLHSEAVTALYGAGLDPFIGFMHALDFGRESLACDVVEPLRVDVDRFSLRLFKSGELRPEDFSNTESGCMLGKAGRSRYYQAYEGLAESLRRKLAQSISDISAVLDTIGLQAA